LCEQIIAHAFKHGLVMNVFLYRFSINSRPFIHHSQWGNAKSETVPEYCHRENFAACEKQGKGKHVQPWLLLLDCDL